MPLPRELRATTVFVGSLLDSCHAHRLTCTSPSTGRTYQLLSDDEEEPFEISDDEPCKAGPFEVSDDDEEIQREDSLSTSIPEPKGETIPGGVHATEDDDVIEIDPAVHEISGNLTDTAKPSQADVESVNKSMEVSDSDSDSIASSDCEPSERPIGRGSSIDIRVECPIRASAEADDNNQEISSDSGVEFSDNASLAGSWPDSDNSDEDIGGFFDDDLLGACDSPNVDFDASVSTEPLVNSSDLPPYDPATDGHHQWLDPKRSTQLPHIKHAVGTTTQAPLAPMFPSLLSVEPATMKPLNLGVKLPPSHSKPLSMPSPSDAALKGARATTPPWRTEKQEFLAARVDNRAKFAEHWMDMGPLKQTVVAGESSIAGGSLGDFMSKSNAYNQRKKPDSNSIIPEDIMSLREKPSVQAMLLERELPLKRKRDDITVDEPLEITKAQAPETAQATAAARNIKAISDARAMRRAQAVTTVFAHNNANRAAEKHVTTATATTAVSNSLAKADTPTPATKFTTEPAISAAPTTALEPRQDQERPAKRQKQEETKAARRFAYSAFGGFVAGAGLFAALVATAPDFGSFV